MLLRCETMSQNGMVRPCSSPASDPNWQVERLTAADPGNVDWQRNRAINYGLVAMVEAQQGARDQALSKYRTARDIIARLKAQSPDDAQLPKDLAWVESQIRALLHRG